MEAKLIEYAYPSSKTAKLLSGGSDKIGGYFITIYPNDSTFLKGKKLSKFFLTKEEAIEYADRIPQPYHMAHYKYFLQS